MTTVNEDPSPAEHGEISHAADEPGQVAREEAHGVAASVFCRLVWSETMVRM